MRNVDDLISEIKPTNVQLGISEKIIPWLEYVIETDDIYVPCYAKGIEFFILDLGFENLIGEEIFDIIQSCKTRFVVIPLTILDEVSVVDRTTRAATHRKIYKSDHQNMIIVDKVNGIVERFEPNGTFPEFNFVDTLLLNQLSKPLGYSYLPTIDICPNGPQKSFGKEGGFCVTWSALYMHLRLRNPDIPPDAILDYLTSFSPSYLLDTIRKYQTLIDSVIK